MAATPEVERLGPVLAELLESGDPAAALACLAPDAVLWHNSDKQDVDAGAGFAAVTGLHELVDDVRVEVLERAALPDGFLQRYVIRGTVLASGAPLAADHCIFVRTDGALIIRIDEYVDPTLTLQLGLTASEVSP
jgi:ketosteroid isomerase-like protein